MTSLVPSLCNACTRLRTGGATCDAYPGGIPQAMLTQLGDHRTARAGDQGLRFVQLGGADAAAAFDLWHRVSGAA
jgi:hypothetical protein